MSKEGLMELKNARSAKRYDVLRIKTLKGWLEDRNRDSEYLANISSGGAGFYSSLPLGSIHVGRLISCWFEFPPILSGQICVQGNIVHITELKARSEQKLVCYGIRFLESDRDKLIPVIDELEKIATASPIA